MQSSVDPVNQNFPVCPSQRPSHSVCDLLYTDCGLRTLSSRNDHDRIMLKMSKVTRQDLLWSWQGIVSNINPKKKRVVDEPTSKTIGISKKWNQSKKWILNLSLTLISWGLAYYFIHYVGDEAPSLQSYIFPLTYEGYKSMRGDHYILITRDLCWLLNRGRVCSEIKLYPAFQHSSHQRVLMS